LLIVKTQRDMPELPKVKKEVPVAHVLQAQQTLLPSDPALATVKERVPSIKSMAGVDGLVRKAHLLRAQDPHGQKAIQERRLLPTVEKKIVTFIKERHTLFTSVGVIKRTHKGHLLAHHATHKPHLLPVKKKIQDLYVQITGAKEEAKQDHSVEGRQSVCEVLLQLAVGAEPHQ